MNLSRLCRLHAETDFATWLARSRTGDTIEYHRGYLALDRHELLSILAADLRRQVIAIADAAYAAAEEGLVHLVQRRLESHCFGYLAIRLNTEDKETLSCQGKARLRRYAKRPVKSLAGQRRLSSHLSLGRYGDSVNSDPALDLQIRHVRSHYAVSLQLAMVIAEHAYNAGGRP